MFGPVLRTRRATGCRSILDTRTVILHQTGDQCSRDLQSRAAGLQRWRPDDCRSPGTSWPTLHRPPPTNKQTTAANSVVYKFTSDANNLVIAHQLYSAVSMLFARMDKTIGKHKVGGEDRVTCSLWSEAARSCTPPRSAAPASGSVWPSVTGRYAAQLSYAALWRQNSLHRSNHSSVLSIAITIVDLK